MILKRNVILLATIDAGAFGNVSRQEAVLGAATSYAVAGGKNISEIVQRLSETALIGIPTACNGDMDFACMISEHRFKVSRARLDMKRFFFNLTLLGVHQILLTGRPCLGSGTSNFPLCLLCVSFSQREKFVGQSVNLTPLRNIPSFLWYSFLESTSLSD